MKYWSLKAALAAFAVSCTLPAIAYSLEEPVTKVATTHMYPKAKESVVLAMKQIHIDGYPNAFNPSMIKTEEGILLTFRNIPDNARPFISDIGALLLNDALEPISPPQLLITRKAWDPTPQQSEDARIFRWRGDLYLIYNDNIDMVNPSEWDRRDIFIAKLSYINGKFIVDTPKKLIHSEKYEKVKWQKNWQPFEWNGTLLLGYSINPHEILAVDPETGVCSPAYETEGSIKWHWGKLRGGAPAQMFDDHYLAFFHSATRTVSETTQGRELMHYFMGAYTFSTEPPFQLTGLSPYPIFAEGFYTASPLGIRCFYPGGFVVNDGYIYIACGKDDHEVWITIIDKEKLYDSLIPVFELEEESSGNYTGV